MSKILKAGSDITDILNNHQLEPFHAVTILVAVLSEVMSVLTTSDREALLKQIPETIRTNQRLTRSNHLACPNWPNCDIAGCGVR